MFLNETTGCTTEYGVHDKTFQVLFYNLNSYSFDQFIISDYNQILLVKITIKNWFSQVHSNGEYFFGDFHQSVFTVCPVIRRTAYTNSWIEHNIKYIQQCQHAPQNLARKHATVEIPG